VWPPAALRVERSDSLVLDVKDGISVIGLLRAAAEPVRLAVEEGAVEEFRIAGDQKVSTPSTPMPAFCRRDPL